MNPLFWVVIHKDEGKRVTIRKTYIDKDEHQKQIIF